MFGGFGGVPRKPGQSDKPALGAVQGPSPTRIITPSTLGQVEEVAVPGPVPMTHALGIVPLQSRSGYVPMPTPEMPVTVHMTPAHRLTLSILILTLSDRASMLSRLIKKLEAQIQALGPLKEVEVLVFRDSGQHSVGAKRNRLLDEAKGEFVVYIDDDDDVGDDYVYQFLQAIHNNPGIDCIGMRAVITTNGGNPRQAVYSIKNQGFREAGGVYYRPPSHVTPIRRSIALCFRYPDKNVGEDSDVALRLTSAGALQNEYFLDKVQYHYQFLSTSSKTKTRFTAPVAKGFFHIVILSARAENLRRCLRSILENEPGLPRERIIVVDGGARAGCGKEFPGIHWVKGTKPFSYARNANLGIRKAPQDVLLLHDDARLLTKFGFTSLSCATRAIKDIGISSAATMAPAGIPAPQTEIAAGMRVDMGSLPFIAAYIPRETINRVGVLEERLVGNGQEDEDYCFRARREGLDLAVYDGCIVEHVRKAHSTSPGQGDVAALSQAKARFGASLESQTPEASAAVKALKVSCILTSYNRPTLVRQALKSLQDQTHKNFEVLLFDDSSQMDIQPIVNEFHLPISQIFITKVTPLQRRSFNRLSVNINRGLAAATGDLVCFLADDDYYFPTWFDRAAKFFAKYPEVQAGYGRLIYSHSSAMEFNLANMMRWPGTVVTKPYERLDHNQVMHRRFPKPYTWPEDFKTLVNPDAHYFRAISAHHAFYPIDAYAAVKRLHRKNLQKTVSDVVGERAENIRE